MIEIRDIETEINIAIEQMIDERTHAALRTLLHLREKLWNDLK